MDVLAVLAGELAAAQMRRSNCIEQMAKHTERIAKALRAMSEEDLRIVDLEQQIRRATLTVQRKAAA